ncbi:hypothetical protein D6C91_05557 [Aureobasidium pullulans]|uniref:Uncharacterized protein n=2 Tax=Aureobasidium pullulans TaxID=5580 RepID=A0A4S9T1V4_AURPU|nr:hypothetical protein D6C91_05557 [Aureobasidium pullulans]
MSEEIAEKNESEEEVSENDRSEEEVDEDDDVENVSEPDATEVDVLDTEATSDQEAHHFGVKNPILINFQGYTLTMGLLNTIKAKAINKEDKVRRLSSNRPSEWNHGGDKEESVEFSESGGTDTIVGSWLAKSFRLHPDSADIVKDIVGLSPAPCKISKVRKI